jgi:hypothetical protein
LVEIAGERITDQFAELFDFHDRLSLTGEETIKKSNPKSTDVTVHNDE